MAESEESIEQTFNVEWLPISAISRYPRNPRKNEKAVEPVMRSIKEFGWNQPIVVDADRVIIVGDTRYQAAQKLGLAQVPVLVNSWLSPEAVDAYRIADNKTGDIAVWDEDLLAFEIGELDDLNFDLSSLAMTENAIAKYLAKVATGRSDSDLDRLPEDPETRAKLGDVWLLGNHRLVCGDSSSPDAVDRLVNGEVMDLAFSDPPYNVAVEPRSKNAMAAGTTSFKNAGGAVPDATGPMRAKDRPIQNDKMSDASFDRVLRTWFAQFARVLAPGGSFYFWGGYANCANYPEALEEAGFYFAQAIIWEKQHPVVGRKDFMGNHEWCFYGWKTGAGHKFYGPHNIADVWRIVPADSASVNLSRGIRIRNADGFAVDVLPADVSRNVDEVEMGDGVTLFGPGNATDFWSVKKVPPSKMEHLTQKPTRLAVRGIKYSTKPNQNVIDLFGGSGSTLIAAEETGRRAFVMELDPAYCDVILSRWESMTGLEAKLEGVES